MKPAARSARGSNHSPITKNENTMQHPYSLDDPKTRGPLHGKVIHRGLREPLFHWDDIAPVACLEAIKAAKETPKIMSDLIEQAIEAKTTLQEVASGIGEHIDSIKPMKKEVIEHLRGMRSAATTEVAAMLKPLEDLRKFFLGAEHDKEIERLREFVDLCERLEKLKQSGFLDSVADTMLKLS